MIFLILIEYLLIKRLIKIREFYEIICLDRTAFFLLYINYITLRRYPLFHKKNYQQSNGIFSNNDNQAQEIFLIIKPIITNKLIGILMKLKYHNKNKEEYLIKIIIIVIIKDFYEKWFRNGDYSYIVLTNKGNISNNSNSKTNYEKIENKQRK